VNYRDISDKGRDRKKIRGIVVENSVGEKREEEKEKEIGGENEKEEGVGSGLKPMRTGHKQGEMQSISFTCGPR
jgi:hypothetical protein